MLIESYWNNQHKLKPHQVLSLVVDEPVSASLPWLELETLVLGFGHCFWTQIIHLMAAAVL